MFYPSELDVLGDGTTTRKFSNRHDTADSPLAAAIFKVKGVSEVLLASKHVTVTKSPTADWDDVGPNVELVISQFYAAGLSALKEGVVEREAMEAKAKAVPEAGSLEEQIVELLEERVKPFVQQDGGDIDFDHFDANTGTLYLQMHGACAGCPKSTETLQQGIKSLMQYYLPEVKEIVHTGDVQDEIPRPRSE